MALNLIVEIGPLTQTFASPNFVPGNTVRIVWDDVANVLAVYTRSSGVDTLQSAASSPILTGIPINQISGALPLIQGSGTPTSFRSNYSVCAGANLYTFTFNLINSLSYPYVTKVITSNAGQCQIVIPACDIQLNSVPVIAYDGNGNPTSVTATATSSKGIVKYSLDQDLDYTFMSNTSGVLPVTSIGTHTIYARDSANCKTSISVNVVTKFTYAEKYRLDYFDIQSNVNARIRIFEYGYGGTVINTVEGQDTTIVLNKPSVDVNNKFVPLQPSYADIMLTSMSNFQYISLFTQDDKRYQLQYERPVGTLRWKGFGTPSVFNEQYIAPPYGSTIRFVDGLNRLKDVLFLDDSDNRIYGLISEIKIIALILAKTGLDLPILSAINMFESTMTKTVTDDPLLQAFQNCDAFYDDDGTPWNCNDVLAEILKPYGSVIYQDDGFWNIIPVEAPTTSYNYRTFDATGVYTGNGNFNPVKSLDAVNLFFADQGQQLEIIPAYGKINLAHELRAYSNYLPGGDFTTLDWNGTNFNNWILFIANAPGVSLNPYSPVYKNINLYSSKTTRWATYGKPLYNISQSNVVTAGVKFRNLDNISSGAYGSRNIQYSSVPRGIIFQNTDNFNINIKYRVDLNPDSNSSQNPIWIRLRYSVYSGPLDGNGNPTLSGYYFCPSAAADPWIQDVNFQWNDVYCTSFNSDQTFSITNQSFRNVSALTSEFVMVTIWIEGSRNVDFDINGDFLSVKNLVTYSKAHGTKMKGRRFTSATDYNIVYLELISWDGTTSAANDSTNYSNGLIIPNDFNSTNNPVMWQVKQDKAVQVPYKTRPTRNGPARSIFLENSVNTFLLSQVALNYLPQGNTAPAEEDITLYVNTNYKENLEVDLKLGDLPETPIDSGQYIYKNFSRKADGTPTKFWARNGIAENNTRQKILLKSIAAQYGTPTFKITGPILNKVDFKFRNSLQIITPAVTFTFINPEFSLSTGWVNAGSGSAWSIDTGNSWAICTLAAATSQLFIQSSLLSLQAGTRISIQFSCTRSAPNTSDTTVAFNAVMTKGGLTVQTFNLISTTSFDDTISGTFFLNLTSDIDSIGFYITRTGPSTVPWKVDYFRVVGVTKTRFFTPSGLAIDDRNNNIDCELLELLPVTFAVDGEGGINNGTNFSGDYNNDYGGDFDTLLN